LQAIRATMSSKNKRLAIIPFEADFDESKASFITHKRSMTQEGVTETVEEKIMKLHEEASPFEILKFLHSFRKARTAMAWLTAPKLFQKFPLHLDGYHLEMWESVLEAIQAKLEEDADLAVENFDDAITAFKEEVLQGYHYEDQMDYLRGLKKPGNMSPGKFLMKYCATN